LGTIEPAGGKIQSGKQRGTGRATTALSAAINLVLDLIDMHNYQKVDIFNVYIFLFKMCPYIHDTKCQIYDDPCQKEIIISRCVGVPCIGIQFTS